MRSFVYGNAQGPPGFTLGPTPIYYYYYSYVIPIEMVAHLEGTLWSMNNPPKKKKRYTYSFK
jgi:hypothetical protein